MDKALELSEEDVLAFDPFEGDFGAPGDKVFTNKMSVARKAGSCSHCRLQIEPGERVRRQTSKFDGEMMTHRWCNLCCAAMASYYTEMENDDNDDLPAYERRIGLGDTQAIPQEANHG
jgi:hypothetical protein